MTRQTFFKKAEDRLAGIRGSLLLFAQGRLSAGELAHAERRLNELRFEADADGLADAARLAGDCADSLELFASSDSSNHDAYVARSLDMLSRLEAEVLQMPLGSDAFLADVNELVDASFANFKSHGRDTSPPDTVHAPEPADEDFDVDDETLEIFRSEAEGLLANIAGNLKILGRSPDDTNALWEIRRNAHTFKGAAGIIGFREASDLAHRIEDLLDKMVESRCGGDGRVIELLATSTARLDDMTAGKHDDDLQTTAKLSADFETLIASVPTSTAETPVPEPVKTRARVVAAPTTPAPIVRVSLDRLDDILNVARGLSINRGDIAARYAELKNGNDAIADLDSLIETQQRLSDEMLQMLMQVRMVRFGTLEMRLNRAVHVTCQEEGKNSFVVIENPDVEIDTLVIDAFIEPLLHLLKNSVVHGIELPETRRLIGKPEKGLICITVNTDETNVYLSVEDDGSGISGAKLLEKAIATGIIDAAAASTADDAAINNLIFHRGLTTAEELNLNAGRGIGMSIVKESVESRGGCIAVESEQQKGTKFTIRFPLTLPKPEVVLPEPDVVESSPDDLPPLILIIDDSLSIRRMTAKIVEEADFRSITAEHGAEALELLLSGAWEPDLILSDVEMPIMDGWEFLQYVKTDDNFGHIPVVMITSLDSDEYRKKAFELGASDYLVKPLSIADLDRVFENLGKVSAA